MSQVTASTPLIFGEVLFDRFPDGSEVLGGAPFNVSWHLQAFGAAPRFVSRVGDDPLGRRIRTTIREWGMDDAGLQTDREHPTGTVEVRIENDEPSFDIVADRAYDFISANHLEIEPATLLYHGSLALRSAGNRHALERILETSGASVFLDVNLRPPWWDGAQVLHLLETARWAKLNEAELEALAPAGNDLNSRAVALQEACDLELLIVTLGAEGAMARTRDSEVYRVSPKPSLQLVDTVGAGDAFSSIAVLGLLRGWDLGATLERAQAFAAALVGIRGATPGNRNFYQPFLDAWR
jgi:fructokinase